MGSTLNYIHKSKEDHPDYDSFSLKGRCHDCGMEMETIIAVDCEPPEIIQGGGFWHFDDCSTPETPNGNFMKCPECMEKDPILRNYRRCEVWSRVVGYLRPVSQWNKGKQVEFKERKNYKVDDIQGA